MVSLVSELEIKAQKENFEKQSYTIKSDAEAKLGEIQALLEAEQDRHRIEVRISLGCFDEPGNRIARNE